MLKHYVEFLYPGMFTSETTKEEIAERNESHITLPKNSFGFRFTDREEVKLENGKVLKGEFENSTGIYYEGRKMNLSQIKKEMPESTILISNMECNHWDNVVVTKFKQVFPLNEKDIVR